MLTVKLTEFLTKPRYYGRYFFRRLIPYQVNLGGQIFKVKYRQFWQDAATERWEPETFKVLKRFVDKDHVMIDIGAWIGPTTLFGASLARNCFAFEPDPAAFGQLRKNVALNPRLKDKITLFHLAISPRKGNIKMGYREFMGDSTASMLTAYQKRTFTAMGVRFADWAKSLDLTACNFIKMDIEGGEAIILPTMASYLQKNRPTLYLSLHPQIFKNLRRDTDKIMEAIAGYRFIYSNRGENISRHSLKRDYLLTGKPAEIVLTNKRWR